MTPWTLTLLVACWSGIDESERKLCCPPEVQCHDEQHGPRTCEPDDEHGVNAASELDTSENCPSLPDLPEASAIVELPVQQAIERSLPYLKREASTWISNRGCVSCHRVSYMIWAHGEAQTRGFDIDRDHLEATTNWALVSMLAETKEHGGADTVSQMLLGRDRRSPWRVKPPRHFKTVDPYERLFEILLDRQPPAGTCKPLPAGFDSWIHGSLQISWRVVAMYFAFLGEVNGPASGRGSGPPNPSPFFGGVSPCVARIRAPVSCVRQGKRTALAPS